MSDQLKQDQADFEDNIFRGRRFSDLQKYLKSVFKCNRYPETMSYKDNKTNEDSQKCKYFKYFFSSVFLASNTIKMKNSYEKRKFNKVNIDQRKIREILTKLQTNNACGPDNVENTILKNLPTLSKSLHIVFQAVINKGCFPAYWKTSEVIPIFKDENRAMIELYRPISSLCNVSKVLEKIILNEIYEIVNSHLNNPQHGFKKHRSVVKPLLLFLDLLYKELGEKEGELYLLYLDFKKAFDGVPRNSLQEKLKSCKLAEIS